MFHEFELSPANQELERALGELKPASPHLDRDRLMFRAGQASVKKNPIFWPALSGALSVLLAISWMVQFQSPSHSRESRELREAKLRTFKAATAEPGANPIQWVVNEWESPSINNSPSTAYLALRNRVLKRGLDGLPKERTGNASRSVETWSPFNPGSTDEADVQL
jgi:hypothetical protein